MKCPICKHGETRPATTTVRLDEGGTVRVIEEVRAEVYKNCGEVYVDEKMTAQLLREASELRGGDEL